MVVRSGTVEAADDIVEWVLWLCMIAVSGFSCEFGILRWSWSDVIVVVVVVVIVVAFAVMVSPMTSIDWESIFDVS